MSMRKPVSKPMRQSLPGLTRQSSFLRKTMDPWVKPAGDGINAGKPMRLILAAAIPAAVLVLTTSVLAQQSPGQGPRLGKPIAAEDLAAWDISIGPDGAGLPAGSGTVKDGAAVFAVKCQACHGEKGAGTPNDRLVGGQGSLPGEKPAVKTVGSYWPYATTLFDYIRRAMPLYESKSLTNDEVYGVVAYLLNLNGVIAEGETMNAQTLPKVTMPNREGFVKFQRGQ
jgi:S-disulfanyl-L-cysteine oxidoreductase SoxD